MRYIYEIAPWTDRRRVRGTDQDENPTQAWAFQPAEFSSEALGTLSHMNTVVSVLETLVNIFTGEDPMEMLQAHAGACNHEDGDDCDCPPVTIEIPAALAYHAQQLNLTLEAHNQRFKEFDNQAGSTVRNSPDHRGNIQISIRFPDGRFQNLPAWEKFEAEEPTARFKILNRWYRTGIMLKQALGNPEKG